jgi:hypothetical protein
MARYLVGRRIAPIAIRNSPAPSAIRAAFSRCASFPTLRRTTLTQRTETTGATRESCRSMGNGVCPRDVTTTVVVCAR